MNKRQKKKKGLLLIKKTYSNWGNKKNKLTKKKEIEEVKVEVTPIEEVVEEIKEEQAPTEAVKEEVGEIKEEEAPVEVVKEEKEENK